MRKARVKIFC